MISKSFGYLDLFIVWQVFVWSFVSLFTKLMLY